MLNWLIKFIMAYQQIEKVRSLKDVPNEWGGRVIGPPNAECLIKAERVLKVLHKENLYPDRIISSGEGGVAFCWLPPQKHTYAAIEVTNNDELLMLSIVSNKKDHFEEFSEDRLISSIQKIKNFITGEK